MSGDKDYFVECEQTLLNFFVFLFLLNSYPKLYDTLDLNFRANFNFNMVSFGSIQIFEKKRDCVDNYEADVMSLGIWTLIRLLI